MNAEALIGKVLGSCTLQEVIGQGGMGAVYLAQQSRPRRQVAVKVLLPSASLTTHQRAAFLERFRRETDAAASLEHPNILPVHEYGERDGLAYLVVPYISGGTLRDLMEAQGQLALPQAMNYLDQVAGALDFAHGRGVIHRDIKPANILMTPEGRLMLTDFGLVKIIAAGQMPQLRLTGAGAPVGTPDYMSPEQVVGNRVDGRSDLYSLGVILYQMLAGVTPFQGETPMQIAAQQWQSPPPSPRLLRPDLPVGVLSGNVPSTTPSMDTSTSARLFAPRGLFDPVWQQGATGTLANVSGGKPTRVLPAANAEPARSTGLLSRTGMFPTVAATGNMPAAPGNNVPPAIATGVYQEFTGSQPPLTPPGLGAVPLQNRAQPSPIILGGTGKFSAAAGAMPSTTGAQPAAIPMGLLQASPVLNTSGSLAVPGGDQGAGNTIKLTGPVKVVQVPVAGQPGRFVTGLLPVVPQTQEPEETVGKKKRGRKQTLLAIVLAALVLLVIAGTGASFWFVHLRQSQTVHRNHILNTEGNAVAVVLPQQNFTAPNAYTLTMWEVKGDNTSNNNSFGMIIRFSQQTKGGKTFTTFYSFEVLNTKGGDYRFYKYDDSQSSPNKYWTQLWSQPFGREFHLGQGSGNSNTIRIYQNGSSFSFTVNAKLVKTFKDNSLKSGSLGMLVNLKGTEVAFMNMLITRS